MDAFLDWCKKEQLIIGQDYCRDKEFCCEGNMLHLRVEYHCMNDKLGKQLNGESDRAIEENQFQMYLQPQATVDVKVTGAEVLVRWQHPTRGFMMPGSFVEIFERSGQIVKLDQCIWEMACKKLHEWKLRGRSDLYLSVNISTRDFYFIDVYQTIREFVEKYEIEPQNLRLEITENAVMMNLQEQLELIRKLRAEGFIVERGRKIIKIKNY